MSDEVKAPAEDVLEEPEGKLLAKMAIKDLPVGRLSSGNGTWDYSHLLKPEQKTAGYRLKLTVDDKVNAIKAGLHDPQDKKVAGTVAMLYQHGKSMIPHAMEALPPELRGQGFGRAMYESMYAHAYKKMGVKVVAGGYHTAAARRVHESLARRHGLKYDPEPGFPQEDEGPRGGPYEYALSGRKMKKGEDAENQEAVCPKCGSKEVRVALIGEPVYVCQKCDKKWAVEPELENSDIGTIVPGVGVVDKTMLKSDGVFESPSWVKHAELPPRIQRIFDAVRANLTPDLLAPRYAGHPKHPLGGHCYVAVDALFNLLDGARTGWKPCHVKHEGDSHWFMRHDKTGTILDPTAEQFDTPVPYDQGVGKGLLTLKPSKRAQTLIDRIQPSLVKNEEEFELQELAKTVGYITFPKFGITNVQEPMTYPASGPAKGNKGRAIFGARVQLASDPRESPTGGIVAGDPHHRRQHAEDIYDVAKKKGYGVIGTLANLKTPLPNKYRIVSGIAMGGKVHGLVGVRAHEGQHSVFGQLAQKYSDATRQDVIQKLINALPPEGREAGKQVMGVSGYSIADYPEEFVTSHQQFLTDEKCRKNIYGALGIKPESQRDFFKVMRRNFEQMRQHAAAMKPTKAHERVVSARSLQKSISSIPTGKVLAHNPVTHESMHDYTHVLTPQAQSEGYTLRIRHIPRTQSMSASVSHKGRYAGSLLTYHRVEDGTPVLGVDTASVEPGDRGKGLGLALYEASYAHAKNAMGIRRIVGDSHSAAAHGVHEALARKHGLEYQPDYADDEEAGPYEYLLKEEVGFQEQMGGDKEHEFVKSEDWTPEDFEQYEQVLEKAVRAGPGQLGLPGIGEDVPGTPEQEAALERARAAEKERLIASGQLPRSMWRSTWHERAGKGQLYPVEVDDFLNRVTNPEMPRPPLDPSGPPLWDEAAREDRPALTKTNIERFLNTHLDKMSPEQRLSLIRSPHEDVSSWVHYNHNKLSDEEFKKVMPTLTSGNFYTDEQHLPPHRLEMMLDYAKQQKRPEGEMPTDMDPEEQREKWMPWLQGWETMGNLATYHPMKNEMALRVLQEFPKEHGQYWRTARDLAENGSLTDGQMSSLLDAADKADEEAPSHIRSISSVGEGIASAATTPELQRKSIDFLLRHAQSEHIRRVLRGKKNLHPDVWREALNRYPEGIYAALQNPALPADMLPEIAKSKQKDARAKVAAHPAASQELLEQLSNDKRSSVRKAAQEALRWHDPSSEHDEHVEVKFGTNKLRQLRDHIVAQGEEAMSPKDLPAGDWKAGRDKAGNISAKKIQEHIDSLPGIKYGVSEGSWKGGQRHSRSPSYVFQLNLSTEQVHKLKDAGVYGTFRRMHQASTNSGHPVGKNAGLGWVRWTGDEKGIHIDEVQSDLGQSFVKQASAQAAQQGQDPEEAARRAEKDYPEEHYKKIKDIVFGGRHPSEVLQEAFHQYLRNEKKPDRTGYNPNVGNTFQYGGRKSHVGVPIHIWTPESKATISLHHENAKLPGHFMVGYRDVPSKKMGMRPASYGDLPTQTSQQHQGKATWQDTLRKREPGSYTNLGMVEE